MLPSVFKSIFFAGVVFSGVFTEVNDREADFFLFLSSFSRPKKSIGMPKRISLPFPS